MFAQTNSGPLVDMLLLEAAVSQSFNAVVITDAKSDGEGSAIVYCNPAFCAMTGYSQEELIGQSPRILQGPGTDPEVIARLRQCLLDGSFFSGSTLNYRKDGTHYHLSWNISAIRNPQGEITHYVSVQQDVSRLVETELNRNLLAKALNSANTPVAISDRSNRIVFANRAFELQSGYSVEEVIGQSNTVLLSAEHSPQFYHELRSSLNKGEDFTRTFIKRRKNGTVYHSPEDISIIRGQDNTVSHYVSISKELSGETLSLHAQQQRTYRDDLTNLLNRTAGGHELHTCQNHALEDGTPYSIILCDIDNFTQLNDEHTQEISDRVLVQIAQLLEGSTRHSDHIAHWSREEFLVILPGVHLGLAREMAERLRNKVAANSFENVGNITLSLGVSSWLPGHTPASLLQDLDSALYQAKSQGCNRVVTARSA